MSRDASLIAMAATQTAAMIASRAVTAEDAMQAYLARIASREPELQAWSHINSEPAIAAARALDQGPLRGPLHGLPVAIKDIIATADMPTEYGSPIYRNHRPAWDAACVSAIRKAGGIILGKTVTSEFASSHPGKTVNPHDSRRTPGGSSSGSAAAVADFMVPLAVGTQTGGSLIRPASFCGIVGYKPSFGLINRHGVKPLAESLDTVGAMARSVEDAALLVAAMAGWPRLLSLPEFSAPRIGIWRTEGWLKTAPEAFIALDRSARLFAAHGARVEEIKVASIFAQADSAHHDIEYFEMARALAYEAYNHSNQLSPALKSRIEQGASCTVETYEDKRAIASECRRALTEIFLDHDILLTPSAPGEAPEGHASTGNAMFNRIWTLFRVPALTIPAGRGPNGLPVGIQIIGGTRQDVKTLAISRWAERILTLERDRL